MIAPKKTQKTNVQLDNLVRTGAIKSYSYDSVCADSCDFEQLTLTFPTGGILKIEACPGKCESASLEFE